MWKCPSRSPLITFNVVVSPVINVAIVDVPQRWCEVTHDVRHSEVVNELTQFGMSSNQSSYCLTIVNQIKGVANNCQWQVSDAHQLPDDFFQRPFLSVCHSQTQFLHLTPQRLAEMEVAAAYCSVGKISHYACSA